MTSKPAARITIRPFIGAESCPLNPTRMYPATLDRSGADGRQVFDELAVYVRKSN